MNGNEMAPDAQDRRQIDLAPLLNLPLWCGLGPCNLIDVTRWAVRPKKMPVRPLFYVMSRGEQGGQIDLAPLLQVVLP